MQNVKIFQKEKKTSLWADYEVLKEQFKKV